MRAAYFDHSGKDVGPGLLILKHSVREHAAIPAYMAHCLCGRSIRIVQPHARMLDHIHFTVRIQCHAVPPSFIVAARAMYRAVILRNMKINGPWLQGVDNSFQRCVQRRTIVKLLGGDLLVLWCVIAQCVKHRMCHIRLKSHDLRAINGF